MSAHTGSQRLICKPKCSAITEHDSRGRVRVVPFQKVSLKGTLVKFCPSFSARSATKEGKSLRKLLKTKKEKKKTATIYTLTDYLDTDNTNDEVQLAHNEKNENIHKPT